MRIYPYLATAVLLTAVSACHFLDEDLKGGFTADTYYTTESRAEMAVNAVYNSLYDNTLWIFGDVASDDAVKGGNAGDQAEINSIDNFTASADNGVLSTFWTNSYETVSRANNVIANVASMNLEKGDRLVAEAKFLRSYAYFNLINIFGPVPYKTLPQNSPEAIHVGLSSVEAIYQELDRDLVAVAAVLPESYSSLEEGRATKGAALALLAKVRLFQKDWNGCLAAISQFEAMSTASDYVLEPKYADHIFAGRKKHTSRAKALSIALAMGLTPKEAQYLLYYAGAERLYVRNPWDSVLWYALEHHMTVMETNLLLQKVAKQPLLGRVEE